VAGALDRIDDVSAAVQRDQAHESLAEGTIPWLADLPQAVRLRVLPQRFPHIANALAQRWTDAVALRAYMDQLLIDTRGNRRGLPLDVADELATLKDFIETVLHPVPQTVWDEVAARKRIK
jgi:hypothetical protein